MVQSGFLALDHHHVLGRFKRGGLTTLGVHERTLETPYGHELPTADVPRKLVPLYELLDVNGGFPSRSLTRNRAKVRRARGPETMSGEPHLVAALA